MPITYNQTGVTYDAGGYTYDGEVFQPTVFPIAGVYIALDDGPYNAAPAWTEVTQYVRGFTTHRGRSSDFDQFDTGTAQITLSNRDRRFDPFYTSGPYYGKLLPRRQVRVVGQIGGTTYEVFRGFIAGWPVTWSDAGYDSTVTVQCFDALGLMANEQVPTDWADYISRNLNPVHYWKLNDTQNVSTIKDYVGTLNLSSTPKPFTVQSLADGLISQGQYLELANKTDLIPTPTASGISLSFWVRGVVTGATYNIYSAEWYYGGLRIKLVNYGNYPTAPFALTCDTLTTTYTFALTAPSSNTMIVYDEPKHFVVTFDSSANATLYVNGRQMTLARTTVGASGGITYDAFSVQYFAGQEISAYNRVLSSTEATSLYDVGSGMIPESSSARMTRILDTTSWPAALEAFPASPVGTVSEIGSGTGVIPELQLVADSEGGELYVTKAGVLTMTARRDVFNATRSAVSQATITDSGTGLRYGTEVEIRYDADNLKNDVTVTFSGDGEVSATNATTIAAYGAASTIVETQLDSPTSAADLATLELGVEGVLVPQVSPIDISPNTAAADWQTILGLELLDRVTFKRTPTVGNQFNRAALINAIDHQVEPGVWRTQLTLSMRYTSPLTCDDDVLGKVDYNYCG